MTLVRHSLRGEAWRTNAGLRNLARTLARKGAGPGATLRIHGARPGDAVTLVDLAGLLRCDRVLVPWPRGEEPEADAAEARAVTVWGLRVTWGRAP